MADTRGTQLLLRIGAAVVVVLLALAAWGYWPPPSLPADANVDRIVVHKAARTLELLHGERVIARYRIALGAHAVGPKQSLGDGRTPEGDYVIDYHNPTSRFHRALHISYPSANDTAEALRRNEEPGGMIEIHGASDRLAPFGRFQTFMNWTDGCIAVTDAEIERIFDAVADGTPIRIEP